MVNWKTKLPALGSILTIVGEFFHDYTKFNYAIGIPALLTAVGVLFAKQHDVTGGTIQQ